jgi:hypothetical protein
MKRKEASKQKHTKMLYLSFSLLFGLCTFQAAEGHSCYWYVVYEDDCKPGSNASSVESCMKCAAEHSNINATVCTPTEINATCHGILPPSTPTPAPGPITGALALTLLHDAAAQEGAVCLDGTPGGYYFRTGKGDDKQKWLVIFQGGGWCYGSDDTGTLESCVGRSKVTLRRSCLMQ